MGKSLESESSIPYLGKVPVSGFRKRGIGS